ncbi:MAG: hypothetical protein PWQ06_2023 [Anaerophaga sp.]|nr:hypothetical protein [Anaerophaga sp.]
MKKQSMTIGKFSHSFFILVILGLLISCSHNRNNDRGKLGLNGDVKFFFERQYEAEMKFGNWQEGDIENYGHNKVYFTKDGFIEFIDYLNDEDELTSKYVPELKDGKVVKEIYYDEDGELLYINEINHISKKELKFVGYNKDGEKVSEGISIFGNNRIEKIKHKEFEDGKVSGEFTTTFEYDQDGNLIVQKEVNKSGEILQHYRYEYLSFDTNNNWTKRLEYSSDSDKPDRITIREYEYY